MMILFQVNIMGLLRWGSQENNMMKRILSALLLLTFLIPLMAANDGSQTGFFKNKQIVGDGSEIAASEVILSFSNLLSVKIGFRDPEDKDRIVYSLDFEHDNKTGVATSSVELFWSLVTENIPVKLTIGPLEKLSSRNVPDTLDWEVSGFGSTSVNSKERTINSVDVSASAGNLKDSVRLEIKTLDDYRFLPARSYTADLIVRVNIS